MALHMVIQSRTLLINFERASFCITSRVYSLVVNQADKAVKSNEQLAVKFKPYIERSKTKRA